MATTTKQHALIELLARNETVLSQLYRTYAKRFPAQEAFWNRLTEDELRHADWVHALGLQAAEGAVAFKSRRYTEKTLRGFIAYIKELIPRAEYHTLVQCLSLALDIEKALIEKKFFVVFAGDSPAFARLLKRLAAATGKHIEAVRKMWEKHRL